MKPDTALSLSPLGTARQRLVPAVAYPPGLLSDLRDADLGEEEAFLAWQMGQLAAGIGEAERSDLVALVARSLISISQGSTRMGLAPADRALLRRVPALVGAPGERKPLIVDGEFLYHQKVMVCETRLAAAIKARAGQPGPDPQAVKAAVAEIAAASRPALSDEQRAALAAALGRRLAVISGGPGTGKTTIALALGRGLVRLGVPASELALAAPTGKAAHRLQESFHAGLAALPAPSAADQALQSACPAAQTLHRLLGYSPATGRFLHHQNYRLAARAVIVDEGSMIDLSLMDRLSRALRDDAVLVLLGDADQLPSVDAGAVFRDLSSLAAWGAGELGSPRTIAGGYGAAERSAGGGGGRGGPKGRANPLRVPISVVSLHKNFRTDQAQSAGRRISECAAAVRTGDANRLATLLALRTGTAALAFDGVELVPGTEREAVLERWYRDRIVALPEWNQLVEHEYVFGPEGFSREDDDRLTSLHAHMARQRVLCVTRERPTGANPVNAFLHGLRAGPSDEFLPGEPVLVLRNDYDRGLWNGDQGFILSVKQPGQAVKPLAVFRQSMAGASHWLVVSPEALRDNLALAYALTVHKAQGSEHDQILLLLPEQPLPLLTRELLYTALTRARHAVVICGSAEVLAAGTCTSLARFSGLAERLV
jgi:exodeoxyribonuclease V alpha subunit